MKKYFSLTLFLLTTFYTQAQRSDNELSRDSILDWRYLVNAPKQQTYKPVKDAVVPGSSYTVWQQQTEDMLFNWVKQSVALRGIVMRYVLKDNEQWWLLGAPALHSYGIQLAGFPAHYNNGKVRTDGEHGFYMGLGVNNFPGEYIKEGFNPDGLYLFAEYAQFSSGETDEQLKSENVDKKILPALYDYRTYLDHYHDNGKPFNRVGVVITKNGEWPFKPVLVKDIVDYINRQLAAYPGIAQKNPYSMEPVKKALARLQPYYNEVTKLRETNYYNAMLKDDNGHAILNPDVIINGLPVNKTFPEYRVLVSATKQVIDRSRTDNPLWLYMDFSANQNVVGNIAQFDPKFSTDRDYLVNTLLRNFNFDYAAKWLSQPEAMKGVAYTPMNAPAKSAGNTITAPVAVSANASAKNKDPNTILFDDFDGYAIGTFSAKGWHTFGKNGNAFENATLSTINGQTGKWISIPDAYTFYPDFTKPLPATFTVNYDVYFDSKISNKRSSIYFRLDAKDPKKSGPIDLHDMNRSGFQFGLALSGETETSKRYMDVQYDETIDKINISGLKANDVAHVSIAVNGAAVTVSVNGKEVMHDNNALPSGKKFLRYGWYCGVDGIYLGNIFVKSSTPVKATAVKQPQFAGVVEEPKNNASPVAAFENTPYTPVALPKLNELGTVNYPTGFKSTMPPLETGSDKAAAGLKIDYKFPQKSTALTNIPTTVVSADGFKKLIATIQESAAKKLQSANTEKIDNYLKTKKISTATDISNLAINEWMESKPTVALYLFCKAIQTDYADLLTANNLASLLIAYGYAEQAIPLLQYLNKQTNAAPEVLANLAAAYYNLGDQNTAIGYAEKCIDKDSLNRNANKVAAFAHINKAAQSNNSAETVRAIDCLKQALKTGYDKEASDILGKIESNHQKSGDFYNNNFKEFPLLKRIEMPAMPEDLHQMISFDNQLELEKTAINNAKEQAFTAYTKAAGPTAEQMKKAVMQNNGAPIMIEKASAIFTQTGLWYIKMKKDLEDIFFLKKQELTKAQNQKLNAITKEYNAKLSKLEGGEGNAGEEEEIEELQKQKCKALNDETEKYLSAVAKLTNNFAQQSEYVSRVYCRDYANWAPVIYQVNNNKFFLDAQRVYLTDVYKILSFYAPIEPCIYPTQESLKNNTKAKPKEWENEYCANFKGSFGAGAAKLSFTCNSMSISGGEGFVGDLTLNYNENGTFKDVTIGGGPGVEAHWGSQNIASLSAGASVMEYVTISAGPNGMPQVSDWGTTAGIGAGANVGPVGGEANILSGKLSANSGVSLEGAIPDGLKILNSSSDKK